MGRYLHENSEDLSSTIFPSLGESHPVPAQTLQLAKGRATEVPLSLKNRDCSYNSDDAIGLPCRMLNATESAVFMIDFPDPVGRETKFNVSLPSMNGVIVSDTLELFTPTPITIANILIIITARLHGSVAFQGMGNKYDYYKSWPKVLKA